MEQFEIIAEYSTYVWSRDISSLIRWLNKGCMNLILEELRQKLFIILFLTGSDRRSQCFAYWFLMTSGMSINRDIIEVCNIYQPELLSDVQRLQQDQVERIQDSTRLQNQIITSKQHHVDQISDYETRSTVINLSRQNTHIKDI
jgi:hypothetical protein